MGFSSSGSGCEKKQLQSGQKQSGWYQLIDHNSGIIPNVMITTTATTTTDSGNYQNYYFVY